MSNQTSIGIFAHVDAGKTTLCEAILYTAGAIRKLGRVDNKTSWFDTFALERKRGITIFSKQATFLFEESAFTILDTPGHMDFVAEAERTIPVVDFAVLLISASDGIQPHTLTLWRLLEHYHVPVILFVTKTDAVEIDNKELISTLKNSLSPSCVMIGGDIMAHDSLEEIASQDIRLMEQYLENGVLDSSEVRYSFYNRHFFPVLFGSGLKLQGITDLLSVFHFMRRLDADSEVFGAKVFKITHDIKGNRLTHMRIMGGTLKNRSSISYKSLTGSKCEQKITEIRVYNSEKYSTKDEAFSSEIVAVTGLSDTYSGQGLGAVEDSSAYVEPVLRYEIKPISDIDSRSLYLSLLELQEEEPQLRLSWDPIHEAVYIRLMGAIQTEIIRSLIWEKYRLEVEITNSQILYKETIAHPVEGVGHFEPLRHYAEVHLLIEPAPPGSGLTFGSILPTDRLGSTWQNMILYHLQEKKHIGVLGGFPLTDVRITLVGGKVSLKHTEGGDIREATLRAVRQGLMQAENVLLEPYYKYTLTLPTNNVGRAATDIQQMSGSFEIRSLDNGNSQITGYAPVSEMQNYSSDVAAYTGGYGKLICVSGEYRPCHNTEEIISSLSYDPDSDTANPSGSIFCRQGSGFSVRWDQVKDYMHLDPFLKPVKQDKNRDERHHLIDLDEEALEELMLREFGPIRRKQYGKSSIVRESTNITEEESPKQKHIIIDGYNLMFLMAEKGMVASGNLDLSRKEMLNILASYSGFSGAHILVVFDAYHNPVSNDKKSRDDGIDVIFTDYGETADAYIERTANILGKNDHVRVISSDNLVRLGVFRSGIQRTSSAYFYEELVHSIQNMQKIFDEHRNQEGQPMTSFISKEIMDEWQKNLN